MKYNRSETILKLPQLSLNCL